ncbi:MAG: hypothetical protein ABL886_03205 [Rhodoglobus sp.]
MAHAPDLVRHAPRLAAAFALTLVCSPGRARADDESERKRYLLEIETTLGSASGKLSGFESDSDAGDLDAARNYVREVESLVDKLDDVKGDDSQAKDVASRYPRYISDWYEAAGYLRQLKERQKLASGYLTSCKAWDEAMKERARTSKDAPNAVDELSTFAKSVGRQGEDLMAEARRVRDQLDDANDEVRDFSAGDNGWTRLRDVTRASGDQIWRLWDRDYQEAVKACEEVIKRERHRSIEEALGRLGNSKAGRAELRTKLTAMLGVIADRVNDVDNQSSESNVSGAIEVTREVASLLDRLKSSQGDDDEARKIAAEWPSWNNELRAALEGLRTMKQKQRMADAGGEKCDSAERELQALIKDILGTPTRHKDGVAELERAANKLRDEWKPRLDAAAQGDRDLNDGYRLVKAFNRSEGPWGSVRDRMVSSADDMLRHWTEKYGAAKYECTPLTAGLDNADVKAATTQLGRDLSSAGERSKAFYAELKLWEAEIGKLRDWSDKDVEEIRAAFCRAPDAGDYEEAIAVADRWASQLKSQYGTIAGRAEQLKQAADALIAKGRSKDRMDKVKAKIDAAMASIDKIKAYQLQGSNNPLFKAQTSYGVAEHARRQGGCSAKEITIRGDCDNPHPKRTDCRIDCMKGCLLVEIKPRSQMELGQDQADAYLLGLLTKFARSKLDMFKESGMAYFEQCLNPDKSALVIKTLVDPYDFCEGMTNDELEVIVPSVDVASEVGE